MVADANEVDVLLAVYIVLKKALWGGGVEQAISFDAVASVDKEEINAFVVGVLAEVLGERDVVAPVSRVLWSAEKMLLAEHLIRTRLVGSSL